MNACIRAVTRRAIYAGREVVGVRKGYAGLIAGDFIPLGVGSVADIVHRGGTILHTGRSEEFKTLEGQRRALENLKKERVGGLVLIGGDGTMRGAMALEALGVATIGVPATIDNDLSFTEQTIGFDTAVNTVVHAINHVRDTASSHDRTFIIEVMGRERGFIALAAGLAGGAESILIPEIPPDMDAVCHRLIQGYKRGKVHSIILVSEGVAKAADVAREIQDRTGLETRTIVLGHVQRGGTPTATDRILGSRMGAKAVELLLAGDHGKMVALWKGEVTAYPYEDVLGYLKPIDLDMQRLAEVLAI